MSGLQIINNYFTKNYKNLQDLATARLITYKRDYDSSILVSNAWEHCVKHQDSIRCDTICQTYAFKYITSVAMWDYSPVNIENDANCKRRYEAKKKRPNIETELLPIHARKDDDDINSKLKLEEWITERKAVLEMFKLYLKEKDMIKYKTFLLMLRGYNSSGLLSEYLGITRNGAWNLLRNVRRELNEYKKRYNLK